MDPDFFPSIYGVPRSAESGGLRVEVGPDLGRSVRFVRGAESYLDTPSKPLSCEDPVVAPDGSAAYLRCMRIQFRRSDGFGADYDSILHFRFGPFPLAEATPDRMLLPAELEAAFPTRRACVSDLDRVSSGRGHLLLRIGVELETPRGRSMRCRPYWYGLTSSQSGQAPPCRHPSPQGSTRTGGEVEQGAMARPTAPASQPADGLEHLPERVRAEIRLESLAREARALELVRRQRRHALRDTLAMALLFAAGDLICPGARLWTPFAAAAAGAVVGAVCQVLDGKRLLTGVAGLVSFFVFQAWSRAGLTPLHLFFFFGFGSACAYLGYRREEREMD